MNSNSDQDVLDKAIKESEESKLNLQNVRRLVDDLDERIVQLQSVIDELNIENSFSKNKLKALEIQVQTNEKKSHNQQQYSELDNENKNLRESVAFLKAKVDEFGSKVSDNENAQVALRKTIEELQASAVKQREDLVKVAEADNSVELKAEIRKLKKQLQQAQSVSDQQSLVINSITEELTNIEQMTNNQWFSWLQNRPVTKNNLKLIEEELSKNEKRADALVQCSENKFTSDNNNQSVSLPNSFEIEVPSLMEPLTNKKIAKLACKVYNSIGSINKNLNTHINKLMATTKLDSAQQKNHQNDAGTANTLEKGLNTNEQHQSEQADNTHTHTDHDSGNTMEEELTNLKKLVYIYKDNILILQQKLEKQKVEHNKKITHITNKANGLLSQEYERYKTNIRKNIEHVEARNRKQVDKLTSIIETYELDRKMSSFSSDIFSQREQVLLKFIKMLIAHSKNLQARVHYEATLRADFAFMKRFFMLSIQSYTEEKKSQIKLLKNMGIYVDHEAIRLAQENDLAERQRLKLEVMRSAGHSNLVYNSDLNESEPEGNQKRRRRFSRIEQIESVEDETERNQQKDLYYRNVASGKRKIVRATYMYIAAIRLRKLYYEKKKFQQSYNQVKSMIRDFAVENSLSVPHQVKY